MKTKNLLILVVLVAFLATSINAQTAIPANWIVAPTATFINGDISICKDDSVSLIIDLDGENGNGWDIVYSDGKINHKIHASKSPHIMNVAPNTTTIYTLISVNNGSCDGDIVYGPYPKSGEVVVTVHNDTQSIDTTNSNYPMYQFYVNDSLVKSNSDTSLIIKESYFKNDEDTVKVTCVVSNLCTSDESEKNVIWISSSSKNGSYFIGVPSGQSKELLIDGNSNTNLDTSLSIFIYVIIGLVIFLVIIGLIMFSFILKKWKLKNNKNC